MEDLIRSFKALSHENRLQIILQLMNREYHCYNADTGEDCTLEEPCCEFGELIDLLGIHKSTLSHHLKELRVAGLVETVREGRAVTVRVNRQKIERLKEFFDLELLQSEHFHV